MPGRRGRFGLTLRAKLLFLLFALSVLPAAVTWVTATHLMNEMADDVLHGIDTAVTRAESALARDPADARGKQFADHVQAIASMRHREMLWNMAATGVGLLLGLTIVLLVLSRRLAGRMSEPIERLAKAMSDMDTGERISDAIHPIPDDTDLARLSRDSGDELGDLARRFNTMATTIAHLRGNLEEFKARMERASQALDEPDLPPEDSQRLQQRRLEEAAGSLAQLDRDTDELLSMVRHELKTPLTSIVASSEALLSNLPFSPEKRTGFIHIIQEEAQRLTRLINEVLDPARPSPAAVGRERPVDLRARLRHAVRAAAPIAEAKGVTLDMEIDDDERLASVPADADRLAQAVTNLLDNAIRFTPAGGRVVLGAGVRRDGDERREVAHVFVKDTGPGIPPAIEDRVFEKYETLDPSTKDTPGGRGLGMAIAREIVEGHGGRIWFATAPGGGAIFHFTLPLMERHAASGGAAVNV
ncbi:HAMP domain-containing protein [bacterium]|nr:HAMP domain-containing protein [bacterium]